MAELVKTLLTESLGQSRAAALDETVLDYLVGIINDQDAYFGADGADLCELIGPFLLDTQTAASEDEALAICQDVVSRLVAEGLNVEAKADKPVPLAAPVKIASIATAQRSNLEFLGNGMDATTLSDDDDDDDPDAPVLDEKARREMEVAAQKEAIRTKKREDRVARRTAGSQAGAGGVIEPRLMNVGTMPVKLHGRGNMPGSRNVKIDNLSIAFGGAQLLTDTSLSLSFGRRYGIVGRNGIGKSTLLRCIASREVAVPKNMQILYIEQEVTGTDETALECVLACDVERSQLLAEEKKLIDLLAAKKPAGAVPNGRASPPSTVTSSSSSGGKKPAQDEDEKLNARLNEVYNRLSEINGDTAEARASAILAGLQFTPQMQITKSRDFSGGWRMRIALARALFCEPDLLLLDEPTNHLDLHACLWLEAYLSRWKNTLVVVSHARDFLNAVATDIIHVFDKKLHAYAGNYDAFEKSRTEKLKNMQRAHEAQELRRKHVQKFIDRFRYNAKRAAMAQSRIKLLQRMQEIPAVSDEPHFQFSFPAPEELPASHSAIQVVDVSFGYSADKVIFKSLNFSVDVESRIALVGANGAGKSTVLKILSQEEKALSGQVMVSGKLRIAQFSQHHVDSLALKLTPLEHLASLFPNAVPQTLRSHLGSMGISGELAMRAISTLSGGQKSRVAFAVITWTKPHLLLLDEPTNHLDIDTIDALIQALNEYEGGVVLVSHDQRLISAVCDELWVCESGRIKPFPGDFEGYKQKIVAKMQGSRKAGGGRP